MGRGWDEFDEKFQDFLDGFVRVVNELNIGLVTMVECTTVIHLGWIVSLYSGYVGE